MAFSYDNFVVCQLWSMLYVDCRENIEIKMQLRTHQLP